MYEEQKAGRGVGDTGRGRTKNDNCFQFVQLKPHLKVGEEAFITSSPI